jgi:hypothetical protein
VLVLILCVVQAGIRREGVPQVDASSMSTTTSRRDPTSTRT